MASWTVPSGCYYAVYDDPYGSNYRWLYYGAGTTIPDSSTLLPNYAPFVLIDFTNGYIYTQLPDMAVTITISNNAFTVTSISGYGTLTLEIHAIASQQALTASKVTLAGNTFSFGNGIGLRPKSDFGTHSGTYSLAYSFQGRSDIPTSFTVPSGVTSIDYAFSSSSVESVSLPSSIRRMSSAFSNCTDLQTVSGTISSIYTASSAFSGCTSLTSVPTFQSITGSYGGSFQSTFQGCTSLTTAPTLPNGITGLIGCFYGCTSLVNAPVIPSSVTSMKQTFQGCTSLVTAPTIPNTVTNMYCCYRDCTSLTMTTDIPSSVTNMGGTFMGCTSLTTAPTIPSTVTANLSSCFNGCTSLAGAVTIDASPSNYANIFTGTENEIVLFGTGAINEIATAYENVYVWSLSQTITAVRSTPTTTVDISVDVSRYNAGNLVSLKLYKDNASTPLVVTWSDPTLAVTTNPTTFTTSITGVADGTPTSFTVIATDIYGSANAMTVNVPVAFYTMDVQAGGKEIAFGTTADDDVTNYPDGLFKCAMSFKLKDNLFWVGTRSEYEQAVADDKMPEHTIVFITDETADYVVEEGTSGIWTYRKWNSGVAECWGRSTVASTSYSANGGYKQVTENLPSGLFNASPNVVEVSGRIQTCIQSMMGFTAPNSATSVQTYLVNRGSSAVTNSGYVDWNIKGTWK